jgi:hypothetical protein
VSSGVALLFLSLYALLLGKGDPHELQGEFTGLSIVGIPLILTGIGILRRKRYGALLVYASFLYSAFQLCSSLQRGMMVILECLALSLGLGFCSVYYFKRRKEFARPNHVFKAVGRVKERHPYGRGPLLLGCKLLLVASLESNLQASARELAFLANRRWLT